MYGTLHEFPGPYHTERQISSRTSRFPIRVNLPPCGLFRVLRAINMRRKRIQFTLRELTLAVALAALLAFNMTFMDRIFLSSDDGIRAAAFVGPARVLFFTISACTVGGLVGCFTAITIWRSILPEAWPAVRGGVAGLAAGFLSWFFGLVLLFIGYGIDGQAPLSALIMGVFGAALNLIPGALLGTCWVGFRRRNRTSH